MQISDKAIVFYVVVGTFILLAIGFFMVLFLLLYNRKHKQFELQRSEAEKAFNNALFQAKYEIRESTLKDIGRELHDNIGQTASLIKIHLHSLESQTDDKKEDLDLVKELTRSLILDIKTLSRDLIRQKPLELGIWASLIRDVERINASRVIQVLSDIKSDLPGLDADTEIILYRMTQEIFQNILKHSDATTVFVSVSISSGRLLMSFCDNGKGFEVSEAGSKGSGLANLAERAAAIGAILEITSVKKQGTQIRIYKDI
jgi:two-component system NarL family sensor kinase